MSLYLLYVFKNSKSLLFVVNPTYVVNTIPERCKYVYMNQLN